MSTVFGPVTFDAKGDVEGMTYEMNVWLRGATGNSPEARLGTTSEHAENAVPKSV